MSHTRLTQTYSDWSCAEFLPDMKALFLNDNIFIIRDNVTNEEEDLPR